MGNVMTNMHDPQYWLDDGTRDPLVHGVPASWTYADKTPTSGTFKCTYNCAPEDRKILERSKGLAEYGCWKGPDKESQVIWWASIIGCPDDVVEFLDFLIMRYTDVFDAFRDIDGPGGNKQIVKEEFLEGIKKLKFSKFKGKNKDERIINVFRWLDPSGEGQISITEWGVLDALFREIKYSIGEFVFFLDRTFDNLDDAWNFLDDDHSGALSFKEWTEAACQIGYFGPTRPIFSFLDKDDEGTISFTEFQLLREFHVEPAPEEEEEDDEG